MFRVEGVRFKFWPILVALLTGIVIIVLSGISVELIEHFLHLPDRPEMPWLAISYGHTAMLALVGLGIGFRPISP